MGFCGKQKVSPAQQFDPLYPGSGAQAVRTDIFKQIGDNLGSNASDVAAAADAARSGAARMGDVGRYASETLGGKYLGYNPYLEQGLGKTRSAFETAQATARGAGNVAARAAASGARASLGSTQAGLRSGFSRAGLGFSTGNQQAQQSASAALNAQLARGEQARLAEAAAAEGAANAGLAQAENAARSGTYNAERQLQQNAGGLATAAAVTPAQLLASIPGLKYTGILPAAEATKALAGGGQLNTNSYYAPGAGDYALQGLGSLAMLGGGGGL